MNEEADKVQDLHERLVAGDPTAPAELAEAALPVLLNHLAGRYAGQDEHLRVEAVTQALMDYLGDPAKYDRSKSKLLTYLRTAANGDMMNLLAKGDRRDERFEVTDPVELSKSGGNTQIEGYADPVFDEIRELAAADKLEAFMQETFAYPVDRELAGLVLDDVRKTSEYVSVLKLEDMDEVSQRAEVKRHKDRIKKTLNRARRARNDGE